MGYLTGAPSWRAWPTCVAFHLDAWCLVAPEGKQEKGTQEEKNSQRGGLSNLQNRNDKTHSSVTVRKKNKGNSDEPPMYPGKRGLSLTEDKIRKKAEKQ